MRWFVIGMMLFGLCVGSAALAQSSAKSNASPAAEYDIQFESVDDWIQDNIDPDVLGALQKLDQDKVQKIFAELQLAMRGTNIAQLGTLREAANELAPLLEKYQETQSYGYWLRTRLDYLEASEELERETKAMKPTERSRAPMAKLEREVWVSELAKRPWPPQATNYVPRLKEIFVSEHLPPELVWVAEVESSFNADARSPAGAAGMFQLMPQTAKDEKLSLWPWDERYQAEKSARAAARYLHGLHAHYGDWELALAAYNVGPARVDKLLKETKGRSFDAIAGRLPAETQMYVPKVEATIRKREGRELEELKY
jgi:membrane-bound lytic murein transglycosylase D